MSLVRYLQDVDLQTVVALQCPSCKATHPVGSTDDLFDLEGEGACLTCQDCGQVALIPRTGVAVADRFPGGVGDQFVPIPHALLDHVADLGLTAHELLVVIVLERYRRGPRDLVFPAVKTIAAQTGLSIASVKRAVAGLAGVGLVVVARRKRRSDGTLSVNTYMLAPLWDRVAELQQDQGSQRALGDAGTNDTPSDQGSQSALVQGSNPPRPGVKSASTRAHPDPAEVEPEQRRDVCVSERESFSQESPKGTSGARERDTDTSQAEHQPSPPTSVWETLEEFKKLRSANSSGNGNGSVAAAGTLAAGQTEQEAPR